MPLEKAVALVTAEPARLFGLERKGSIAEGYDADIALCSLTEPTHVDAERFHTRAKSCAVVFESLQLRARVEQTLVGGSVVFANGAIINGGAGGFVAGPRTVVRETEPV